ncbi:MAG: hypothetical protein MZU79_06460 [Anaerotruncus sp.]|nr:hypothetical protein [Anaerotruncus sp.]
MKQENWDKLFGPLFGAAGLAGQDRLTPHFRQHNPLDLVQDPARGDTQEGPPLHRLRRRRLPHRGQLRPPPRPRRPQDPPRVPGPRRRAHLELLAHGDRRRPEVHRPELPPMSAAFRDRLLARRPARRNASQPALARAGRDRLGRRLRLALPRHGARGPRPRGRPAPGPGRARAVRLPGAHPEKRARRGSRRPWTPARPASSSPTSTAPRDAVRAVHWAKYPPKAAAASASAGPTATGPASRRTSRRPTPERSSSPRSSTSTGSGPSSSILGVSGVDAVFIGPYDLSASLGKPGRIQDADVREAVARGRGGLRREKGAGRHLHRGHPGAPSRPSERVIRWSVRASISAFSPRRRPTSSGRCRPRNP